MNFKSTKLQLNYWERKAFFEDIDIAIIGSGIVGLSAALYLKEQQPKLRVVIIERGVLPSGASTRNAGFACFGSISELLDDLKTDTEEEVFTLVEKRWRGLQKLRERVGDINMDYQEWGGFELFKSTEQNKFEHCSDQISYLNNAIRSITNLPETYQLKQESIARFGFANTAHLICNKAEGQIHTGKMMATLLALAKQKGIQIYNGLDIKSIEDSSRGVEIETENAWNFSASKVLIATNGFAKKLLPEVIVRPARNQVLITKPIKDLRIKGCFHYDRGYFYFRNIDNRILLGGGRNLAKEQETTTDFGTTPLIKNALLNLLTNVILPNQAFKIDYWWSGIMGIGETKKAITKLYTPNVAVSVRLGGMGVAIGSLVGEEGAKFLL